MIDARQTLVATCSRPGPRKVSGAGKQTSGRLCAITNHQGLVYQRRPRACKRRLQGYIARTGGDTVTPILFPKNSASPAPRRCGSVICATREDHRPQIHMILYYSLSPTNHLCRCTQLHLPPSPTPVLKSQYFSHHTPMGPCKNRCVWTA